MKTKNHFLAILIGAACSVCHATQQETDILMIKEKKVRVLGISLPKDAREVLIEETLVYVTSIKRGFIAKMTLQKAQLFLTEVFIPQMNKKGGLSYKAIPLKKLFKKEGPVKAEWFSGELVEFHGERLGFSRETSSQVRIYIFEKGVLKKKEEFSNEEYWQRKKKMSETPPEKRKQEANKKAEPSAQP